MSYTPHPRQSGRDWSDARLLAATPSDPSAFAEVYDRHVRTIYGWFRRRLTDEAVALDLTSETFAVALSRAQRFRDEAGGSAAPWLFGIARNLLASYERHRRVDQAARAQLGMPIRNASDPTYESAAEHDTSAWKALREGIVALPDDQRAAVELRVIEGLSYDEVAERLSISPGAGRKRVMRALRFLRGRIEEVQL